MPECSFWTREFQPVEDLYDPSLFGRDGRILFHLPTVITFNQFASVVVCAKAHAICTEMLRGPVTDSHDRIRQIFRPSWNDFFTGRLSFSQLRTQSIREHLDTKAVQAGVDIIREGLEKGKLSLVIDRRFPI